MSFQERMESPSPALAPEDYLDCVNRVERLHRLLLDVIKDEFERLGQLEINPVQALLIYNVGDNVVTAGELKSRGYYQGSNVSYNLKKLVDLGYMHHARSELDRRSVRVGLTNKGAALRDVLANLFARQGTELNNTSLPNGALADLSDMLHKLEQFWAAQIRYIY